MIAHTIRKLNKKFDRSVQGLKEDVMNLLIRYDWPENVRELINVLEGAFINLPEKKIGYADLPGKLKQKLTKYQHSPADERKRILAVLLETNWNKSSAAAKLNWSRMTLYRKISKYTSWKTESPFDEHASHAYAANTRKLNTHITFDRM